MCGTGKAIQIPLPPKKLPESQGPYRRFARMIADQENANFNFPDRPLDLNPRESALIRGKNPIAAGLFFLLPVDP